MTVLPEKLAADLIARIQAEHAAMHANDKQPGEFTVEEYRISLADDDMTYVMAKNEVNELVDRGIASRRLVGRRNWLYRFA